MMLSVDGIGPRSGLAIVSSISAQAAYQAIISENVEAFFRVPGIGKKTAQKIIITLNEKVKHFSGLAFITKPDDVDALLMDALTRLGYSLSEAQSAVAYIPVDASKEIDERLRIALQYFSL
jgi:holliday junction DNA helicase RuvA